MQFFEYLDYNLIRYTFVLLYILNGLNLNF